MFTGVLAACAPVTTPVPTEAPTMAPEVPTEAPVVYEPQPFGDNLPSTPTIDTPLVVSYQDFSQKFSPFFSDSEYDADVAAITQISILTTDRQGGIIFNAIEGETVEYNGTPYLYKGPADIKVEYDEASDTTRYTAKLRVGMQFSDGMPVTADDIIFTYYTFLDPSYAGSTTLGSYDIVGLKDYQTQTNTEVFDKYIVLFGDIYTAGKNHVWSDADAWTQEQQDDLWVRMNDAFLYETQGIVNFVMDFYGSDDDLSKFFDGVSLDELTESEGMQIAYGMRMWLFGTRDEVTGEFTTECTEQTFDLIDTFPTLQDFSDDIFACYEGDVETAFPYESASGADVYNDVKSGFIEYWAPMDESMGNEGVPNISGIVKVDDYTVEVTVNGFSTPAVYDIFGIPVTPLHYYGDSALFDYENNMFGFEFSDLSKQESLTAAPMGAGSYKYVKYDNRVVYFEANEYYYRGCPKIKEIQFKETNSIDVPSVIQTGTADIGEVSYNAARYEEVQSYNSNSKMTGDVITSSLIDDLSYGYVGINAANVNVAGEPGSDASKNLRKALATILAVYRDIAIDSYYGEAARVINYPISISSWAAPQTNDDYYQIAFSVDLDGNPIYTSDMTQDEKYKAAEVAALGFLEAAGFTVDDGMITEAPEGAKLNYEVLVGGDGIGDHPAFAILTNARESLDKIGLELKINDPTDSNILWDAIDAESQELWTATWNTTVDPDMYRVYHSSSVAGSGGSELNDYHITDPELDRLILETRMSDNQNFRKAVIKQAFDVIMDWAVEIPTYQRMDIIIFSTERVNIETLTPDITTFWRWLNDIELIEMN